MAETVVTLVTEPSGLADVVGVFDACGDPERRLPIALLRALLHAGALVVLASRDGERVGALIGVVDGRSEAVKLAALDVVSVPADPRVDAALRTFGADWCAQKGLVAALG